ncbi:unnamed protein product [Heligmosomoides polygyrus]|uniref:Uncharacterized protein n=1 Tax=Heligmosomoides polygyrus TaxID=6339 RepID=A0A183F794_HELPZ|nr:unnamed protein product [Heligmosomoides polygyrus]
MRRRRHDAAAADRNAAGPQPRLIIFAQKWHQPAPRSARSAATAPGRGGRIIEQQRGEGGRGARGGGQVEQYERAAAHCRSIRRQYWADSES